MTLRLVDLDLGDGLDLGAWPNPADDVDAVAGKASPAAVALAGGVHGGGAARVVLPGARERSRGPVPVVRGEVAG